MIVKRGNVKSNHSASDPVAKEPTPGPADGDFENSKRKGLRMICSELYMTCSTLVTDPAHEDVYTARRTVTTLCTYARQPNGFPPQQQASSHCGMAL
jgi:hypothetical protein